MEGLLTKKGMKLQRKKITNKCKKSGIPNKPNRKKKDKNTNKCKKKRFEEVNLFHTNAADLKHRSEDFKNKLKYFKT